jgi:peptidoglycan/LPS O-acetylase OafA/YrhL
VRASWVTGFLIAAAVGVAVHRALLAHDWIRFYYAPDTRADGMLLGCALAFLWHMGKLRPSRLWTAMGAVSLAIFMATVVTLAIGQPSVGLYGITVANLASVALIGSLVGHPEGTVARVMSVQWLRWLGVISYSLYIWQPIVARMGNLTGWPMLAVAIPFAWLSYRLIEKPFRHSVAGRVRQSVEAQEIAESPAPVRLAARRADPPLSAGARRA